MSRSQPSANTPNPSTLWAEWKGSTGKLVYFDKEKKENVVMKDGFKFLVLDQLNAVTGYNKKAKCGIYSNEVRDSRSDVMVVKLFNGSSVAEGLWNQIKEKVSSQRGGFAVSCYIAYKDGPDLRIGNIRFSGCSLGPWFDFVKKHRKDIDERAVVIKAGKHDTSGSVEFTPPMFEVSDITSETNLAAIKLDEQLQEFLKGYLGRTKSEQVNQTPAHDPADENQEHEPEHDTSDHGTEPEPDPGNW